MVREDAQSSGNHVECEKWTLKRGGGRRMKSRQWKCMDKELHFKVSLGKVRAM
jgi:hypothetical protein